MSRHPPAPTRTPIRWILASLALFCGSQALAAIPLVLPPGEPASSWEAAARLTGFQLSPGPSAEGVTLVVGPEGWEIRVHGKGGAERHVVVPAPKTSREREDLLWVAASLAAPLLADAPDVPLPPPANPMLSELAAHPPAPPQKPPQKPRESPPPKPAPASQPEPAPTPEPAPAPAPEPTPKPAPEPAASPPPPPADDAEISPTPRGQTHLAPLLSLSGGLGVDLATDGGPWALDGRGELLFGLGVGPHLMFGLDGALIAPSALSTLGDSQRWSRLEATASAGLRYAGPWRPSARLRLGVADLRFSQGDPSVYLGSLALPVAGLRLGVDRELPAGLGLLLGLGVDRDLATVLAIREDSGIYEELPATRAMLTAGISWRP